MKKINDSMAYKYRIYQLIKEKENELFMIDHTRYNGTLIMRCPFCGDSKNQYHAHLYILGLNEDSPYDPNYYCQRCKTQGFIDLFFLDLFDIYDNELEVLSKKHKINKSKNKIKTGLRENSKIDSMLLPPLNNKNTLEKIKHFENRMGVKLNTKKILQYKMVFNLYDYLSYNNVRNLTRDSRIVDCLDNQYIGFLSVNNEFINMRNLGEITKYNKRYENYNIYGLQDNTKRFYVISNDINLMENITIHIAEGVYDIIGVREHLQNCNDKNTIYAACLGIGYQNLIKYFTKKGIIFANYNIYSDSGIPISEYRKTKMKLKDSLFGEFNVFYNTNPEYKDFGTRKENITLKKYVL